MKIAIIAKTRLPISQPFRGGLEAFTHALCQEYLNLGHNITLYAHQDSDPKFQIKGFYGSAYREDANFEIYEYDEYLSILKDIEQNDFDIVHNNSTHELPIIWGTKADIPVITTLHCPPISKLKAAIDICSDSENLHYILPSKSFQKSWLPYVKKHSSIIPNGVNLQQWPLIREKAQYLFWYGRIVHAKGLDIVMDAARDIDMPLKFAGSIDDKNYYKEHISPRIRKVDSYLGHLSQPEVHKQFSGAAAVVNAVRWDEPFGLTNIEAMSSGVPIAGFDRGALSEIINSKSGVIAKKRNIASLVDAIRTAIPLQGSMVSQQAEKFSLTIMAKAYLTYFNKLL
ncbi:glycosyltransferase [Pedobacter aquatilis]|uniref:glycosyltransferase n=1 Tax=Pedobacter aquatilis TaxID=351343 RepID=UPI00292EFB4E|nr:glycosyltransferase [Pedobacter aquatilis]